MKTALHFLALLALALPAFGQLSDVRQTGAGTVYGKTTASKQAFYGGTPIVQPSGVGQSELTDSTGGTAATTLASTVGIQTITVPLSSLATGLSTSALDLMTNITPGYAFELLSFDFVTTLVGTGSGASQTFNLEIGTTNVTGGVVNTTLTSTNTVGKVTSGTSITAANTGTASDTLSIEMASGGTVFTAGAGFFIIKLRNLDTVNAFASLARQGNAIRSALVPTTGVGLIKGSN